MGTTHRHEATTTPRQGPLADRHASLGATMGAFAGWSMPIRYGSIAEEHTAVRTAVGVFDVSHLGTVLVSGDGATATIARSFTNDAPGLPVGRAQYTLCCTVDGGIIDDLIVYRLAEERWLAVPNAANTSAVVARLHEQAPDRVEVEDVTDGWAVLAVQGPDALRVTAEVVARFGATGVTGPAVAGLAHLELVDGHLADHAAVIARTGYTGERGVEIVVEVGGAGALWDAFADAGVRPVGLGARDTLRLEMGYPLHGNELHEDVAPVDAGLGWAVVLDRGDEVVGRDALAAATPRYRSIGLQGTGRRPLRAGMPVLVDGQQVGETTSGTLSPTLGVPIALARVARSLPAEAALAVDVRGVATPVVRVRPPFVDRSPR